MWGWWRWGWNGHVTFATSMNQSYSSTKIIWKLRHCIHKEVEVTMLLMVLEKQVQLFLLHVCKVSAVSTRFYRNIIMFCKLFWRQHWLCDVRNITLFKSQQVSIYVALKLLRAEGNQENLENIEISSCELCPVGPTFLSHTRIFVQMNLRCKIGTLYTYMHATLLIYERNIIFNCFWKVNIRFSVVCQSKQNIYVIVHAIYTELTQSS